MLYFDIYGQCLLFSTKASFMASRIANFRIQFNAWSHDLTLSPTAKGGGSVGVNSLILELSDSVLGVGERSLLDLGLVAACWCLFFSKLGLALCECGAGGGSCFTDELGLISPSKYRLPRLT